MSLGSIFNYILAEANAQKDKLLKQALKDKEAIIQQAEKEASGIYQAQIAQEKAHLEAEQQKKMVEARLAGKKEILKTKQELIGMVFEKIRPHLKGDKFKKLQISQQKTREIAEDPDVYLKRIRPEYEQEIARFLFGGVSSHA